MLVLSFIPNFSADCPDGWFPLNFYCYRVSEKPSPGDPSDVCSSMSGLDASITDPETLTFLQNRLTTIEGGLKSVWVGYRFRPGRGKHFPIDFALTNFWQHLWKPGEPKFDAHKFCTSFSEVVPQVFKLTIRDCKETLKHLCKRRKLLFLRNSSSFQCLSVNFHLHAYTYFALLIFIGKFLRKFKYPSLTARLPRHNCPDGWKYFEGKCYASIQQPKPLDDATIECAKYDADALKLDSRRLLQFLHRTYLQHDASNSWMGLVANEGQWLWLDGSSPTFFDWDGDAPNATLGMCGTLKQNGKWTAVACSELLKFFCTKDSKGKGKRLPFHYIRSFSIHE